MAEPVFAEGADYFAWCYAKKTADGKFQPLVTFERKADQHKAAVQCMRHLLPHFLDDPRDAIVVGLKFADEAMEAGETGL